MWRPIAVQAFMVEHTIQTLCFERGIDREDPAQSGAIDAVISDVGRFWATPSRDPAMPPPHSTGAVDLTLVDASQGLPLDMRGAIDAIGAVDRAGSLRDGNRSAWSYCSSTPLPAST